ncbi:hypothetical protein FQN57_006068 [Myotisia sp. PD_48]|nr:hypothetical protein FQN57_006068 [Myotisia sp. PD_48]
MATIQPIEARSVHQIQSGQVIVDLCSVVKELVENGLDAGASSIDVRFKNNGLDSIEVQDNGYGISPSNYESVALKHYTSKLSTFEDLTALQTFGFRGEALSSLCAVSNLHIITAQAEQAPKASKLDFELSGKLKSTRIIAGQKGTTVSVEGLFSRLPVRRRELEKNIKREYGKVISLLHAYACISTGVRFSVKNQMSKGKSVVVFATQSNPTTRENISNIYGAKTLLALMPLELELEFAPSIAAKRFAGPGGKSINNITVHGHISKPVVGEGRQTPDRQMFFVNRRPCGLPQIAKAFNEVYKSFNISQSPFVFADFEMDTNAYDVNVSPDKRTILLHDAGALIESLKASLTELFDNQDQTVPHSQLAFPKLSAIKHKVDVSLPLPTQPTQSSSARDPVSSQELGDSIEMMRDPEQPHEPCTSVNKSGQRSNRSVPIGSSSRQAVPLKESEIDTTGEPDTADAALSESSPNRGRTENRGNSWDKSYEIRETPPRACHASPQESPIPKAGVVQNAYNRMRMKKTPTDVATITIGNKTFTSMIGSNTIPRRKQGPYPGFQPAKNLVGSKDKIGSRLQSFAAPVNQTIGNSRASTTEDIESETGDQEYDEKEETENEEDIQEEEQQEVEEMIEPELSAVASDEEEIAAAEESERPPEDEGSIASGSDEYYTDDEKRKARESAKVKQLIQAAEATTAEQSERSLRRAKKMSKGVHGKNSTADLICNIDTSLAQIATQMHALQERLQTFASGSSTQDSSTSIEEAPETTLSLTVSKEDFSKMNIIGQFNLGFILATRLQDRCDSYESTSPNITSRHCDELFIIDQHASDEKYNFERLQAETTVQNQRLVRPKVLDLTAVEEEVIIDNLAALEKNGFIVDVDTSGDEPIGRRCKLISLPLSKEVVFTVQDLEELIVLLSESPQPSGPSFPSGQKRHRDDESEEWRATSSSPFADQTVARPSKVRKMFAMRACRSSIMVGKYLTQRQMEKVVRNMGTIDKPWNCPHGRPTMRHLTSLGQWKQWDEEPKNDESSSFTDAWKGFLAGKKKPK